jgi:hypothetical protein
MGGFGYVPRMSACLTEPAPATNAAPAPTAADPSSGARWIVLAAAATLGVGLVWRAVRYLGQFPIWGDEAMVLLNVLDRDYFGLTHQLRNAQVAPLLFLWLERTALLVFGSSEWSVRLFPCLAGVGGLVMFWRACGSSLAPTAAGLAIGMLAVSYYPIRHGSEAKPYAIDLSFAAFCLWMTLEQLRKPDQVRWLTALAVVTPLAVFSSYPSVFVAGAVSLVLLPSLGSASWMQRSLWALFNVLLVSAFVAHHGIIGHAQIDVAEADSTRDFLRNYWKDAFPPDSLLEWPAWLVRTFTGNMLAHPLGANHGGSTLTFVLVLLGSVKLWRDGRVSLLALCWLPFGLNLVAAALRKYPFGDSARITLHLAPFICVLAAYGLAQMLGWIRDPVWRTRVHLSLFALLLACGAVGIARDIHHPYKTEHDRDVRQLARDIARQVGPDEPVLMEHGRQEDIIPELCWYLRTNSLQLRWQPTAVAETTRSFWRIQCSNVAPGPAAAIPGWRIDQSKVRFVQSENHVVPPMYCRWVHMVRE